MPKSRHVPFFTTRIGASVVSFEPQDPRAQRSPQEIYADPRSRFKDSYARFAKHLNQWLRQFPSDERLRRNEFVSDTEDVEDVSHPARMELRKRLKSLADRVGLPERDQELKGIEDLFVERLKERELALQHLKYEHADSDAKNAQLRNALRASASALQHAATLVPPDIGVNAPEDDHLALIEDLQRQVVAKDNELLGLRKGTSQAQSLAARAQRTLQQALGKWAPSAIPLELQRDVFKIWSASVRGGEVQQRKLEKEFQKRLGKSRAALQSKINTIIGGLAHATHAQEARTVMEAWRSVTKQGKFDKEKSKLKQAQVQQTLMHWMGDLKKTIQPTVFFAWRRLLEAKREEKKAAQIRREHARLAKEEAKHRMIQATLALTGDPNKMDPHAMKVVLRSWRECMLESRAENALKIERARAEDREKERKVQAQRRFAMLATEGRRPMLHGSFMAWSHKVAFKKSEVKRREDEVRFSYLQSIYRAWATLAAAGHQAKELEREKERLQKEQEELRKQLEEQRAKQAKLSLGVLGFAESQDQHVILGVAWAAWKELWRESRQLQEYDAERQQWQREFEDRQKAERQSLRYRASLIAMKAEKELLMPILWAAWRDLVAERRRDEAMDISRRLAEEEVRKAQREAEMLAQEAAKMRESHLQTQQQRQAVFLWSIEHRDQTMLLGVAWSAWRECVEDRKRTEVEHVQTLKKRLHGTDVAANIAAVASESTDGPKDPGKAAAAGPAAVVATKPGCCTRFFRFFVAPKPPPKQGRPVWTPTSAAKPAAAPTAPAQASSPAAATTERRATPPTVTQDAAASVAGAASSSAALPPAADPGQSAGPETLPSALPAGEFISAGTAIDEPAPSAGGNLRRFEVEPEAPGATPLPP